MTVSIDLSLSEAEELLDNLTHDSSNERIGDNTTVTGNGVYLLGLPADVLKSIPVCDLQSSELGSAPQELLDVLVDVFEVVTEIILAPILTVANFVADLAEAIVDLGMQVLATLTDVVAEVAQAVRDVVDAIVDAFNAFVDWAVEFVTDAFDATFSWIVDSIMDGIESLMSGVLIAHELLKAAIDIGGDALETAQRAMAIALSDIFTWLYIGSAAIMVAIMALKGVMPLTACLTGIIMFTVAGLLVASMVDMCLTTGDSSRPSIFSENVIYDWIASVFGDAGHNQTTIREVASYGGLICGICDMIPSMCILEATTAIGDVFGLACTLLGMLIGICSIVNKDARLMAAAMVLDVLGLISTFVVGISDMVCKEIRMLARSIGIGTLGALVLDIMTVVI